MTGIEQLRKLGADAVRGGEVGRAICDIADQIERERACERDTAENIRLIVGGVVDDMERHVSGVEGMEDSPVARWARELREALGGDGRDPAAGVSVSAYDLLPQEEREAVAWVRDHGGLDHMKSEWRSRVPYELYERRCQRLLGHIAECEAALGRRRKLIAEMEQRIKDLETENAKLRKRAMPEGMEWLLEVWPKWSNGEYCKFGDWWKSDKYGEYEPQQFRKLSIYTPEQLDEWGQGDGESYGYEWDFLRPSDPKYRPDKVEQPAPKVLDADVVETRVGDTVYDVDTGEKMWVCALPEQGAYQCVKLRLANGMFKTLDPCRFTHRAPVDSWERLEEDAEKDPCGYFGFDGEETCGKCPASGKNCEQTMARDLVRRCRALAERERGE